MVALTPDWLLSLTVIYGHDYYDKSLMIKISHNHVMKMYCCSFTCFSNFPCPRHKKYSNFQIYIFSQCFVKLFNKALSKLAAIVATVNSEQPWILGESMVITTIWSSKTIRASRANSRFKSAEPFKDLKGIDLCKSECLCSTMNQHLEQREWRKVNWVFLWCYFI